MNARKSSEVVTLYLRIYQFTKRTAPQKRSKLVQSDYIEENPLEDIGKSVSDLDAVFTTIENLRSVYRNKHKEVVSAVGADQYPAVDEDKFQERVGAIKKYILEAELAKSIESAIAFAFLTTIAIDKAIFQLLLLLLLLIRASSNY